MFTWSRVAVSWLAAAERGYLTRVRASTPPRAYAVSPPDVQAMPPFAPILKKRRSSGPSRGSSQCEGVFQSKTINKWKVEFKGKRLGTYTTEEAAVRAYRQYVKDGIAPKPAVNSSQFKGISWYKKTHQWKVTCRQKHYGLYPTEEEAAQEYNSVAVGLRLPLNVIPAAGAAGVGIDTGTDAGGDAGP